MSKTTRQNPSASTSSNFPCLSTLLSGYKVSKCSVHGWCQVLIQYMAGSEASFVICLFSHTHSGSLSTALPFLLARRRLNVAISRAKTLCIVIASKEVLEPDVGIFADQGSASGHAFLRAFEEMAWSVD